MTTSSMRRFDLSAARTSLGVLIAGAALAALPPTRATAQSQPREVYERVKHGTVMVITAKSENSEGDTKLGTGTGFFINRTGLCISNNHVVDPTHGKPRAEKMRIAYQELNRLVWTVVVDGGTEDEKTYSAYVLYQNEKADMALLQVYGENRDFLQTPNYLKFYPGRNYKLGQKAWCYGFPGGDKRKGEKGEHPDVAISEGHIIDLPRRADGDIKMINTDILADPGNSGGPVVDENGHVIGTVTLKGVGEEGRATQSSLVPLDLTRQFISYAFMRGKTDAGIDLEPFYTYLVGADGYVNVPGFARSARSDCVFMESGATVCGKPDGDTVTLTTPLGKLTLPAAQIAYLLAKDDEEGIVLMDGGQRLPFIRGESVFKFVPEGGKVVEQSPEEVKAVAFRKGNKLPKPPEGKCILIGGDDYHLLLRDVKGLAKFSSETAGEVALPLEKIIRIETVDDERVVYTSDGGRMKGEFVPHKIEAVLAVNGAPETLSMVDVKNATIESVDLSELKKERSLVELFREASPDLKDLAATLESNDVSGVKPRVAKLSSPELFNKEGPLKKDQIRLLSAVSSWRNGEFSKAFEEFKKLRRSQDENIKWYAAAVASVLEAHPDGKYNGKPLSDAKVFKEVGTAMSAEAIRRARELLGERRAPMPAERRLFMHFRKRFDDCTEDLMKAGWLGSAEADDVLVRLWNFQADMLENEIFRLQEEILKKEDEIKGLSGAEQEFKGRRIQDLLKGLVRDRDATIKWREELAERQAAFGFIIDDPDLELAEKS